MAATGVAKRIGVPLVAAGLGLGAMTLALAQPSTEPPQTKKDDVVCGGGMVAQDSFWIVPSKDGPESPREALDYYLTNFPGMDGASAPTEEFVLHPDSRSPGEAEEAEHIRYIHPTDAGFDAEVLVITMDERWYVEGSRVCENAVRDWSAQ
jgi:hypothetical protein